MDQNRLNSLLEKIMEGGGTDAEHQEMMDLFIDPKLKDQAKDILFQAYNKSKKVEDMHPETKKQILVAIFSVEKADLMKSINVRFKPWKWVAAAIIIFAISFISIYLYKVKEQHTIKLAISRKNTITPGGNKATLTLADGSTVLLDEEHTGKIARQNGLLVKKEKDGTLMYEVSNVNTLADGTNTISTPLGGKYTVVLADKTIITLNSGSSITYPLSFTGKSRSVKLSGEAYFEVTKDKHRPFIVSTILTNGIKNQDVEVLGTHFNINAYRDGKNYLTTLIEGKIRISTQDNPVGKILHPGQQALVKDNISVSLVNTEAAVAWKNGIFYFSNESIEDLMKRLSRWYNIQVEFSGSLPKTGFWGEISMNKPLSEVLSILETTGKVHFNVKGRRVMVMQ